MFDIIKSFEVQQQPCLWQPIKIRFVEISSEARHIIFSFSIIVAAAAAVVPQPLVLWVCSSTLPCASTMWMMGAAAPVGQGPGNLVSFKLLHHRRRVLLLYWRT